MFCYTRARAHTHTRTHTTCIIHRHWKPLHPLCSWSGYGPAWISRDTHAPWLLSHKFRPRITLYWSGCHVILHCFQEFTDSTSSHSISGTAGGYVNAAASTTEFTIFPPAHAAAASPSSNRLSVPGDRSSVVRFDPLPDIRLPHPHGRRPAAFNSAVSHGLSSQDWFREYCSHVPRDIQVIHSFIP